MRSLLSALSLTALGGVLPAQASPPPQLGDYREATSALAREHQYHSSVAGRVLLPGGAPAVGATVIVYAYQPFYDALPLATARTDENGDYRCDDIVGGGRTLLWVVAPDGTPFRAAFASLTMVSGEHTELRPVTLPAPSGDAQPATTFRGKVLSRDGTPVPGVMFRLTHGKDDFDPSCYALTDGDGSFAIRVRSGTPEKAQLFFGRNRLKIEHAAGADQLTGMASSLQLDLTGERTLQTDQITLVSVSASGAENIALDWQFAGTFRPCIGGRAPAMTTQHGPSVPTLRATAPGHLPRLGPATEKFSFADDAPMKMQVVDDAGQPVKALVDLCASASGARFQETLMQSLPTAADGSLQLLGPKGARTVVYVYAKRHEPARAYWHSEEPLRVVLVRRTARLHLDIDDDISTIYVRRAGTFAPAATVYPLRGGLDIELAPGDYEVTRYRNGPAAAAMPVAVAREATTELVLTKDLRPTIEVTVPNFANDDGWWVHASRSAVSGMVANRAIWTTRGGAMPTRELVAEVKPQGARKFLLRLPTSGRYTLLVGHRKLAQRALREVIVAFGANYAIALPPLDGVLSGTIVAWPDGWSPAFLLDGVAGPRLWLEPAGDTPFGMLVTLPSPAQFKLEQLPRGAFTLHHHLYETGYFRSEEGTWGGVAVEIGDTPADVGKLERAPEANLEVRVLAADGSSARGELQIRDRMSESWQRVVAENSTLIYACDPIPRAPAVRLVDGVATLGKVCKGRLQFELKGDDGHTVFFARDVEPGKPLTVRLDVLK